MIDKSPQDRSSHDKSPTEISEEKLKNGFFLEPDETVRVDISRNGNIRDAGYKIMDDVKMIGQGVAEVRFGGQKTYATGLVLRPLDDPAATILIIYPDQAAGADMQPYAIQLSKEHLTQIGRGVDGQDVLPDTVSRDHCAVGLDEDDQLVVENHHPSNLTAVRKFFA